jgi:hypothetical protein
VLDSTAAEEPQRGWPEQVGARHPGMYRSAVVPG